MKIRFDMFIQEDIDRMNKEAAWTDDQAAVFTLLLSGRLTDSGIMRELNINNRRYYAVKKEIRSKIDRIMREKHV